MTSIRGDFNIFQRFIEDYGDSGYKEINRNDPLIVDLENIMDAGHQFFYMADIIQMKVLFTSRGSLDMIGIDPDELTPYHFMEAAHPSDIQRLNLGRAKVIKLAQELFITGKGYTLMSTNYKFRVPSGKYSDFLVQGYLYYTDLPYKTVFFLKIHTNIDWQKKIRNGYHYYIGNDMTYFRYPDDQLLTVGHVYSDREFEIIKLIGSGLSSEEIAEQLFLSVHTVNTHRRNILEKSGKPSLSELIYDLMERGVL